MSGKLWVDPRKTLRPQIQPCSNLCTRVTHPDWGHSFSTQTLNQSRRRSSLPAGSEVGNQVNHKVFVFKKIAIWHKHLCWTKYSGGKKCPMFCCNESMFSLNPVPEVYESLTVTYAVVPRGPSGGGSSLIHSPAHSPTPQPSTKFVCVARKTSSVVPTVASSSTGSPSMVSQSKQTKCSSESEQSPQISEAWNFSLWDLSFFSLLDFLEKCSALQGRGVQTTWPTDTHGVSLER